MKCLEGLIKIKDYCAQKEAGPFVSDYVDVSSVFLSHLANDSEQSGKQYGQQLINGAIEQVWSDILLTSGGNWSINQSVYIYQNKCRFNDVYSNWGVAMTNYYRSTNSQIHITNIKFKPELDGNFIIVIEDAGSIKEYEVNGIAKTEGSISIDYISNYKQVKIYAKDPGLKFSMLTCQSGGCGSCAAKNQGLKLQTQGFNRVNISSQQSGFILEAFVACDMESAICSVVSRYKSLFSKALAYKVGIMVYNRLLISPRLNDTTLNIDQEAVRVYLNTLEGKYRELVHGSAQAYGNAPSIGLVKIMSQSFKSVNDECVVCDNQMGKSTAVF